MTARVCNFHSPASVSSPALRNVCTAPGTKVRAASLSRRARRSVSIRAAASPPIDFNTSEPQLEELLGGSRDVSASAVNRQILGRFNQSMEGDYRVLVGGDSRARLPKDCLLFHCPDQAELAQKVVDVSGGNVELGEISWKTFPDRFPNLFVKDAMRMRNRHVGFLASFGDPAGIFEQISIIYALPRMHVGSFTLVLPFFPTGTLERVESEGEVATAFTMARILSNIPLSRGGPTSVVIFDIHALQERFYFADTVMPLFESGIPLVRKAISELPDADQVTIAYPDEGAWKRFHYQFGDFPEVICTKVRDGTKRIVRLKEGEPKDRHVVIVDDLVQSGGTLIECQKLLASLGAKHVSAYVTHGVFPNNSHERFCPENGDGPSSGFKHFWLTDSCPQTARSVQGREPFKVLTLAHMIADSLQI